MGLVVLQHVESSQTRDQTHVPCISRHAPNYWITWEVHNFLKNIFTELSNHHILSLEHFHHPIFHYPMPIIQSHLSKLQIISHNSPALYPQWLQLHLRGPFLCHGPQGPA